jgi:MiaB/RimO family radical SAM methylthiotransferase
MILFGRNLDEIRDYFNLTNKIKYLSTELDEKLDKKKKLIYNLNKYLLHSKHIDFRLRKNKVCHIQISVGCLGKCTYCSEKFIVKLKSRKIDDILEAVKDGINRGYQLFALNADDVSAYGKDNGERIEILLERVLNIKGNFYVCIPEFNPNGLSPKVIELLSNKKVLYITIPIQSGSNRVLDKMKRPYHIEELLDSIKEIKKNNKRIKINTHVIVGFPGETEEDFNKTLKVIKKGYIDRLKIFKYSDRPGTEASEMDNKISEEEKERRKKILRKQIITNSIKKLSLPDLILNLEII